MVISESFMRTLEVEAESTYRSAFTFSSVAFCAETLTESVRTLRSTAKVPMSTVPVIWRSSKSRVSVVISGARSRRSFMVSYQSLAEAKELMSGCEENCWR